MEQRKGRGKSRVTTGELVTIRDEFVEWYITPREFLPKNAPKSVYDFADRYKIHATTCYGWARKPELLAEARKEARSHVVRILPKVVHALEKVACDHQSVRQLEAAKLLLTMGGMLEIESETLSPERIAQSVGELLRQRAQLVKRFELHGEARN